MEAGGYILLNDVANPYADVRFPNDPFRQKIFPSGYRFLLSEFSNKKARGFEVCILLEHAFFSGGYIWLNRPNQNKAKLYASLAQNWVPDNTIVGLVRRAFKERGITPEDIIEEACKKHQINIQKLIEGCEK